MPLGASLHNTRVRGGRKEQTERGGLTHIAPCARRRPDAGPLREVDVTCQVPVNRRTGEMSDRKKGTL
eukprot:2671811-Pyramimonas_sp.AAC.1